MNKPLLGRAWLCALLLAVAPATAQSYSDVSGTKVQGVVPLIGCSPTGNCAGPVSNSNPMPVSGSFSATLTGFAPASVGTPLSATTGGATATLPAGTSVVAQNVGAFPAYCQLGSSATGITNSKLLSASGGQWAIAPGSATQMTCEGVGGTTTINTLGGSGLAVDTGGGTSGGGGGTVAQGAAGSNAQAWWTQIGDATHGPAAVKAASTAAVATDPALVVGLSPNSLLPAFAATPTVTAAQATAASLNATVVGTGTFATQLTGATNNINNISGTVSLPTGAATSALQTTGNTTLSTINTTLGSPFQAGGSVGNTSFGISGTLPAFAATPTVNLGTLNGAATSANQTNASQKTQIVDGSGNVIASTSNNLDVQCANCSGSGVSTADGAFWTAGTSLFAGIGGAYQATATTNQLTAGHQGFAQLTQYRALMTDWYNSSGTEMGTAGSPVQVSLANTGTNATTVGVTAAQSTAANLNATVVGTGTFAAQLTGATNNINNVSGTVSLPTGAATAANQEVTAAGVTATSAQAVQGVTGGIPQPVSGTFWQATQPVSAASLPLPIGAATSANQTNASQKTQIVDGSGNVIASTSNNLDVQCANCSGSGVSTADGATWTSGTSLFAGVGGAYQTTATSNPLTTGHQGFAQLTQFRALMSDWFNSSGAEMGTSTTPVQVSLANTGANAIAVGVNPGTAANWGILTDNAAWTAGTTPEAAIGCEYTLGGATALTSGHVGTPGCTSARGLFTDLESVAGTALGSPSNYGTSPGAVEVLGVNAFITNTPTVTANAGTNLNTSLLALETGGNLATTATNTGTIAGAVTSSVMQENLKQVNGVTTLAGAGATGTGSQRETVAQDTTTIAGSAPGTAGSASANVMTVQGIASMTPFLVNPGTAANWGVVGQASTTSGQSGQLGLGAVTTAAPSYTTAQSDPLSLDTSGNLRVNCTTGCSSSGGSSLADEGTYTQGTTSFTVAGGYFNSSITNLSSGQAGAVRLTNDRKMMTDQPNSEVAQGGATAATDALQAGGVYNSSAPTLTTGQGAALQLTAAGSLHATIDNSNANGAAVSASSSPVVIASDQAAVAVKAASGAFVAGSIADLAHGQAAMAASVPVAIASNQSVADPCMFQAKTKVAFSTTSGSTQLVALSGSTKIYVCAIHFISTAADSISFTEGSGTACATGATAVSGSTTAASGMDFPANGGMTEGGGVGTVMATSVAGDELCLLQSGTTKVAGNLMVVQQ
jgi:hypothetical protein